MYGIVDASMWMGTLAINSHGGIKYIIIEIESCVPLQVTILSSLFYKECGPYYLLSW